MDMNDEENIGQIKRPLRKTNIHIRLPQILSAKTQNVECNKQI